MVLLPLAEIVLRRTLQTGVEGASLIVQQLERIARQPPIPVRMTKSSVNRLAHALGLEVLLRILRGHQPADALAAVTAVKPCSTAWGMRCVPTRPLDQKTRMSPPEPIIESRKESSARLPSTIASVRGASGIEIFLKT